MNTYWGHALTSALDWGEWSASRPGLLTSGKEPPGIHWIGGWVRSRAVLDAVRKNELNCTTPKYNHAGRLFD